MNEYGNKKSIPPAPEMNSNQYNPNSHPYYGNMNGGTNNYHYNQRSRNHGSSKSRNSRYL